MWVLFQVQRSNTRQDLLSRLPINATWHNNSLFFFFNISLEWTHKLKLWIIYIYFNLNMLLSDPYLFSWTWLLSHIWTCFFFVFIESNWYSEWQPARGRKVGARCSLRSIQSILWFYKSPYRLQTPGPI